MAEQPLGKDTLEQMCALERGSRVWGWGGVSFLGPKFILALGTAGF